MLRPKRRTALLAAASSFAAAYSLLGAIPVSKLVLGSGNFLDANNFVTPLAGMLFGPLVGGGATVLGDVIDAYAGYVAPGPVGLAVAAADFATAATAGLAFAGRRKAALVFPVVILALYTADPLSVLFVGPIPFYWLHIVAFAAMGVALVFERRGLVTKLSPPFVLTVTFAALMCGQLTGTLVGQELSVRVYQTLSQEAWRGIVVVFFPLYPVERIFFTAVGSLISIPVLRSLSKLRGDAVRGS